ncbi:target of Nesh-SH3-like [Anoplopoma fimbria]|uniref:target of Nesh-SH3-like n=1 Tax=Anoplopoma fimbria TaxID=229290 RepID=UPI0023ED8816|nr:target of Nesh-SH3-like [Anoplopoma fimbria]
MRVRINATGDTIVMKFVRSSPDVKLEGYILGYGGSLFSRQFITLPENGEPYETELDAEPKYLVAVQPVPVNDVKKHCTGKVNLEKPLHLVIGSVSPAAVLLSWGNYLKTPYEGNVMNECLEDGFYTIRYRERNRKWIYQTCPTSDTVVDNLKPNTPYEFGVRSNKGDRSGMWSKPMIHNTNMGNKNTQKTYKLRNPLAKPLKPHSLFPPRPALHNRTRLSPLLKNSAFPGAPRTSFAPPESQQETLPPLGSAEPKRPLVSLDEGNAVTNDTKRPADPLPVLPKLLPTIAPPTDTEALLKLPSKGNSLQGSTTKAPSNPPVKPHDPAAFGKSQDGSSLLRSAVANERARANSWGDSSLRAPSPRRTLNPFNPSGSSVSRSMRPPGSRTPPSSSSNGLRQTSSSRPSNKSPTSGILGELIPNSRVVETNTRTLLVLVLVLVLVLALALVLVVLVWGSGLLLLLVTLGFVPTVNGQPHRGVSPPRPALWSRPGLGSPARPLIPINKKPNLVGKPGETDKVNNFKQTDKLPILKPKVLPATTKPTKVDRKQTTTGAPTTAATRQETWEDSDLFKSQPASDLDALGKKRYVAPHVVYQTGKKPDEPCSITSSLNYFPVDEAGGANVMAPPKSPPSNLTVVTVEGCPSFVILDWEKTDNDTTEYEVISTAKGPDGEQVSILITNQTHTTVENLKPESSYEFKVKPKNELGAGPLSEPVSFNTESADPRVSENVSGKDAIWTQFPFKTDSYSDCHGKQYVKRTWYRKFVGVQLCNSLRYKIYLSDSLNGKFHNIGDQTGFGEDHCQFVDSFLDGRTGRQLQADQLPSRPGFYRAVRQEPVHFGQIGGNSHVNYVSWYECGTPIPGKW